MKLFLLGCSLALAVAAQPMGRGPGGAGPPGQMGNGHGPIDMMDQGNGTVTDSPFSGTYSIVFQRTLPGGNEINRTDTIKVFRDGQGRVRIEDTHTQPGSTTPQTTITICDPVAKTFTTLEPATLTARQMPLRGQRGCGVPMIGAQAQAGQGRMNVGTTTTADLAPKTLPGGLQATGVLVTTTIPAAAIGNKLPIVITRETWTSTLLKLPALVTIVNPLGGNRTVTLTIDSFNEPDASLFKVPSNYTVKGLGGGRG